MSDDFGPKFITLTDEDGKEFVMEHISTLEHEGEQYCLFLPAELEGEEVSDEEIGYVILQIVEEDGEELLASVDDEAVEEAVYNLFMEELFEDEEE